MTRLNTPADVARETLVRLAQNKLPPTPDNYRTFYNAVVTGEEAHVPIPSPSSDLPGLHPGAAERQAIEHALPWGNLISDLLNQLERRHAKLSPAYKREAVQKLIAEANNQSPVLFGRLQALTQRWIQAEEDTTPARQAPVTIEPALPKQDASQCNNVLVKPMAQLLRNSLNALFDDAPDLAREAQSLADALNISECSDHLAHNEALVKRLHNFSRRIEGLADDQVSIRRSLLGLLRLIMDNISSLVIDNSWLHGQIQLLNEAFSQPLDLRLLDDVEARLRTVIGRQGVLKQDLQEAQDRLRLMLGTFMQQLSEASSTTHHYSNQLDGYAGRIEAVRDSKDSDDLAEVIDDALKATYIVKESTDSTQKELSHLHNNVEEANHQINTLQQQLEHASTLMRHDSLTGALNRKGLDEAISREIARAGRQFKPLCLAMLDIDNFKKINDEHGRAVGDQALKHLANVVQENLRPQDVLARYGGEEFTIVLPDTTINDAVIAMTRLQRALTKTYFLTDGLHTLITFSAGVAEMSPSDDPVETLAKADKAMYRAKRAGKNRVFAA